MAPEMLTSKKYSEKVDQYAFAMLLWQMMTGKSVAKGFNDPDDDDVRSQLGRSLLLDVF